MSERLILNLVISGGIVILEWAVKTSFRYFTKIIMMRRRARDIRRLRMESHFFSQRTRSMFHVRVRETEIERSRSLVTRVNQIQGPDSRHQAPIASNDRSLMVFAEGSHQPIVNDMNVNCYERLSENTATGHFVYGTSMQAGLQTAAILESSTDLSLGQYQATEIYSSPPQNGCITNNSFETVCIRCIQEQQYFRQQEKDRLRLTQHEELASRLWERIGGEQVRFNGEGDTSTSEIDPGRRLSEMSHVNHGSRFTMHEDQCLPVVSSTPSHVNEARTMNKKKSKPSSNKSPRKATEKRKRRRAIFGKRRKGKRFATATPKRKFSDENNSMTVIATATSEGTARENESSFGVASTSFSPAGDSKRRRCRGTVDDDKTPVNELSKDGYSTDSKTLNGQRRHGCKRTYKDIVSSESNVAKTPTVVPRKRRAVNRKVCPTCSNSSQVAPETLQSQDVHRTTSKPKRNENVHFRKT